MKKSRLMFFALAALLIFLIVAVLMHGQTTEPGQPGSQPPDQPGSPTLPPPPPPGPPGTITPMILAAYFNCTPINYGDNITIIISAYGISTVNVTVLSNTTTTNVTKDNVNVGVINIGVGEYNETLLPCTEPKTCDKHCNESNGCYIYFNVSYFNGSAVIWRLSDNNLTIWESGASSVCRETGPTPPPVPLPTPRIITPTRFCRDSQLSECCNTTGEKSYYYNASASIWHNATVENWQNGWNWTWIGKSPNVNNNLTNTSNDLNKINLSHIYGLKNTNATNLPIYLTLLNASNPRQNNSASVTIPLSTCLEYQPIVNITSPKNSGRYEHDPLLHNATVIDPDSDKFNFTWFVSFRPWKSSKSILYYNTTLTNKPKDQANVTVKMNFTGNYTSLLLATDGKYGGSDSVSFEVIDPSCNCSDGTPCGAWNPSKSSNTFCNLSKQWEDYCLINENCPTGFTCNQSLHQCITIPPFCSLINRDLGCSAYTDSGNCTSDPCGLGKWDFETLDSALIAYYGCSWNGTHCVQNFTTLNPITGSMENCYYSTNIPPCPERGGEITITRTTTCCKDGSCSPLPPETTSYTCPQPISFALPGWSWLNVVLVVMLLTAFYLALWKWGRRKGKTKK
jgi:hypothetical protein